MPQKKTDSEADFIFNGGAVPHCGRALMDDADMGITEETFLKPNEVHAVSRNKCRRWKNRPNEGKEKKKIRVMGSL